MTNAIEQAKREMYESWKSACKISVGITGCGILLEFEQAMEKYLELLRQDHEALHKTARKRFEDIRNLWTANDDLAQRLAKMTEERDAIQLRLHAVDHSYRTQQERTATPTQDSVDLASCEATGGQKTAIQSALADIRKFSDAWAMTGRRAKKSMLKISGILARPEVYAAMESIGAPTTCMHSFFAIGQDQMKCTFCGVGK